MTPAAKSHAQLAGGEAETSRRLVPGEK